MQVVDMLKIFNFSQALTPFYVCEVERSAGMILSGDERGLQSRGGVMSQQFNSAFPASVYFLLSRPREALLGSPRREPPPHLPRLRHGTPKSRAAALLEETRIPRALVEILASGFPPLSRNFFWVLDRHTVKYR